MTTLLQALNGETTLTENGAKAYQSTLSAVLDFFYKAPTSRGKDLTAELTASLVEDPDLTYRTIKWLRDVREGAGERDTFRSLVKILLDTGNTDAALAMLVSIPELGRFDDLEVFFGSVLEEQAVTTWLNAMREGNALAFKWAPRKDKKGAKPLRKAAFMNEESWRKFVVQNSDTVEQKMCAGLWEKIDFKSLPSLASARYGRAFSRNSKSYEAYLKSLEKGETTINAGAIFPHDVVKSVNSGNIIAANAQWDALPNYLENSKYNNIMSVVDVSGSMSVAVSGNTTAMDVAISLGLYTASKSTGYFKDTFITFSEKPKLQTVKGNLREKVHSMLRADWGMSTDIVAVFDLILRAGIVNSVPQEHMPDAILIISDMQFNRCIDGGHLLPTLKAEYERAGYTMPQLVFWCVAARGGNIPVTMHDSGTALVSGFSPTLLKSVLSGEINPVDVMLRTLYVDRYNS